MENLKRVYFLLLIALFIRRNDTRDVVECGILLKVPCKCGDQEGVQDVWAPSCKDLNATSRNNCLPCEGACDPFSNCKTCSDSGCLSCPDGKSGQFCDIDESHAVEKAQNQEEEVQPILVENTENPAEENVSTPPEEISFQDTKLIPAATLMKQAKDLPKNNINGPFWQTLELLSKEDKEKLLFRAFLRGDVSDPNNQESAADDAGESSKKENGGEEPSEKSEDSSSEVLIQSEELLKSASPPTYRVVNIQPKLEEMSNNEEKPVDVSEEVNPIKPPQKTPEDYETHEDGGVVASELQPEEDKDLPDFEPAGEKEEESNGNDQDEDKNRRTFSEQEIEEIVISEKTNLTEVANQSGLNYRGDSQDDLKEQPESSNDSVSNNNENTHPLKPMNFPIPFNSLLKGLVKLEMLVTSLIHLDGKNDSKSNQPNKTEEPEISKLGFPLKDSKSIMDALASCDDHPKMGSRPLFLYVYDPFSLKTPHVHQFNYSPGSHENQAKVVEVNNHGIDIQKNHLLYRGQHSEPIGFEQVINPPMFESLPYLQPLPLMVNRPPVQYRQPLPLVNSLEPRVENQPTYNKPKHQVRVIHLDRLMNFPSIQTRNQPRLFAPGRKLDKMPFHNGIRRPQSVASFEEPAMQDFATSGKQMDGYQRQGVSLPGKIRIKIVNDDYFDEDPEFLIKEIYTAPTNNNEGNILVPIPGSSKESASLRNPNNGTRIRKHLFRLKREESDWCPIQKTFRNGDLDCTIWSYQKICTLTCHPGFTAPTTYKCVPRGEWDPPLKSCTKIKKQKKANPPYRSLDSGHNEPFPSSNFYDGEFNDDEFESLMYD